MVKLTPDIIEGAGQYINPVRDRELDLRWESVRYFKMLSSKLMVRMITKQI